jgi:hypothetical protein
LGTTCGRIAAPYDRCRPKLLLNTIQVIFADRDTQNSEVGGRDIQFLRFYDLV